MARLLLLVTAMASCKESAGPRATPASIRSEAAAVPVATVGAALAPAPTFTVRDAGGRVLAGVAVTVAVTEGGGTLLNAPTRSQAGPTSAGQWTLGTRAGRNVLTVTVAGVAPIQLVATGTPGAPVTVRAAVGNAQSALAGAELPERVVAEVVDQFGNGIGGIPLVFQAVLGGGVFSPASSVTGADGRAPGVAWRLGARGRVQTARMQAGSLVGDLTATVRSDFGIEVRFLVDPTNPAVKQTFIDAAERIRALVVGDLPDALLQNFNSANCGLNFGVLNETVDDLLILAEVAAIDGPGRILGQAGPCATRPGTRFPALGVMRFDEADMAVILASGRLEAVVLHEMLHVVGVGSIWTLTGLLEGRGGPDPRFIGQRGIAGCEVVGLAPVCLAGGIPVENSGGSGTRDSHWRENVFDAELMTGFIEATPDMPFSVMTLGSLEDFGYVVNYLAADPFTLTSALRRAAPGAPTAPPWEVLIEPRFELGPDGVARPIAARPSTR